MRSRPSILLLIAVAGAGAMPGTARAAVDRVQIGSAAKPSPTRGFSEGLVMGLTSPADYERACCTDFVSGAWEGPRIQSSRGAVPQNASRIDWSVGFARSSRSAASLARDAQWAGLPEVAARAARVPHIVAGRKVGTLKAFAVLTADGAPGARTQGSVAVSLGRRVHAIALFDLADPPSDSSADGDLTVHGVRASDWNRAQADAAVQGVFVEGSLPPSKVKSKRSGKKLTGKVTDDFGHPVSESPIVIQRRAGGGWRRIGKGTTSRRGTFAARVTGNGPYRVVARLAGTTARSRAIR